MISYCHCKSVHHLNSIILPDKSFQLLWSDVEKWSRYQCVSKLFYENIATIVSSVIISSYIVQQVYEICSESIWITRITSTIFVGNVQLFISKMALYLYVDCKLRNQETLVHLNSMCRKKCCVPCWEPIIEERLVIIGLPCIFVDVADEKGMTNVKLSTLFYFNIHFAIRPLLYDEGLPVPEILDYFFLLNMMKITVFLEYCK